MRELLLEAQESQSYRYSILVDEMAVGGLSCESYGLKVVGPDGDWAEVPNITVSVRKIDALAELVRRNQVSPVTLRDVVEDWLP
ncbi:DUF6514 family protein [Pseudoflavonifractor phocaeensis]|uniref:DUF6514 family protein n=1 Tax=Pseudoflavonifractor phocaeensis TaxID=1870988 RepID=UPI0019591D52|nr:DUF6514 family protein [Pseudoflavonifractor phocaeensis]MBM6926649.1 hypothetical protein [Pseudoflavonifractor phocaeensis]